MLRESDSSTEDRYQAETEIQEPSQAVVLRMLGNQDMGKTSIRTICRPPIPFSNLCSGSFSSTNGL